METDKRFKAEMARIVQNNGQKKCTCCFEMKPVSEFYKCRRAAYQTKCKVCEKKYNVKNKDQKKLYRRNHYQNNLDKYKTRAKAWRTNNRDRKNETTRIYFKNNPIQKLVHNHRTRISLALKQPKFGRTMHLFGCSREILMRHIENKFTKKMKWDNYGKYWEVDHIIPCAKFDLTDPEQQKICFHYTNLQPLECSVNRSKSDKILVPTQMQIPV